MVHSSGPTSPRDEFAKDGIVLTTRVRRRAPRRTPRPGTGGPAARPARVLRRTRCTAAGPWIGATGRIGAPCSRRGRAYLGSHAAWPRLKDRCTTLRPAVVLLPVSNPRKRPGGCCVWAIATVASRLLDRRFRASTITSCLGKEPYRASARFSITGCRFAKGSGHVMAADCDAAATRPEQRRDQRRRRLLLAQGKQAPRPAFRAVED
jgi:hypothetical protein